MRMKWVKIKHKHKVQWGKVTFYTDSPQMIAIALTSYGSEWGNVTPKKAIIKKQHYLS